MGFVPRLWSLAERRWVMLMDVSKWCQRYAATKPNMHRLL